MIFPDDYIDKILTGNCLELMKDIPDNSVDLVLTDPPYGVGMDYGGYNDTKENWLKLMKSFIPEIKRIATMVILPCGDRSEGLKWIYNNHPPDWLICWYKGSTSCRSFIGFNDWEPLLVYGKNKGVQMHDYFYCQTNEKMGNYGHPCPKPIRWGKWLIDRATKPGDLVFDPMCGSGTTCVAAKELDRHYIGFDLEQKYVDIANKRLFKVSRSVI